MASECETRSFVPRSLRVFPGGSLGEYNLPEELAVVLAGGQGTTVWDTPGEEKTG